MIMSELTETLSVEVTVTEYKRLVMGKILSLGLAQIVNIFNCVTFSSLISIKRKSTGHHDYRRQMLFNSIAELVP